MSHYTVWKENDPLLPVLRLIHKYDQYFFHFSFSLCLYWTINGSIFMKFFLVRFFLRLCVIDFYVSLDTFVSYYYEALNFSKNLNEFRENLNHKKSVRFCPEINIMNVNSLNLPFYCFLLFFVGVYSSLSSVNMKIYDRECEMLWIFITRSRK